MADGSGRRLGEAGGRQSGGTLRRAPQAGGVFWNRASRARGSRWNILDMMGAVMGAPWWVCTWMSADGTYLDAHNVRGSERERRVRL